MKKKDMKKIRMTKGLAMIIMALLLTAVCVPCVYAATYVKGDIDGNGDVNLNDAKLALRISLGIDEETAETTMRGDIDSDTKLTLKDTQQILKAALGITELGTGETENSTPDNTVNVPEGNTMADATDSTVTTPDNGTVDTNANSTVTTPNTNKDTNTTDVTTTTNTGVTNTDSTVTNKPNIHVHTWKDVVETTETSVLVDAWDEPVTVTETAYVCNQCGKVFGKAEYGSEGAAGEAVLIHQWEDSPSCVNGYHTDKVTHTFYIHHDAETKTVTQEVVTGRTCTTCGAYEEKSEQNAPAASVTYGDVDGNGSVNSCDALEILRHTVGLTVLSDNEILAGDVDGSGSIDACDALYILKYVVGLIDKFPAELNEEVNETDERQPTRAECVRAYYNNASQTGDESVNSMMNALTERLYEELAEANKSSR